MICKKLKTNSVCFFIAQKYLGFVTPFVYMTGACIIFVAATILCIYNADLVRGHTSIRAALLHFYYCLGFGKSHITISSQENLTRILNLNFFFLIFRISLNLNFLVNLKIYIFSFLSGIYILFISPIFVVYQRMRKLSIPLEQQQSVAPNLEVKPNQPYLY